MDVNNKNQIITKFRLPKMTAAKGNTPAVLETQNNDDAEMKAQLEARRKQLEAEQAVCLIFIYLKSNLIC